MSVNNYKSREQEGRVKGRRREGRQRGQGRPQKQAAELYVFLPILFSQGGIFLQPLSTPHPLTFKLLNLDWHLPGFWQEASTFSLFLISVYMCVAIFMERGMWQLPAVCGGQRTPYVLLHSCPVHEASWPTSSQIFSCLQGCSCLRLPSWHRVAKITHVCHHI